MTTFTAQVAGWARMAERRQEAVFKQSVQDLFDIAQTPVAKGGKMPVDTGTLRNSLQTEVNGASAMSGPDSYIFAIAIAKLGDTIFGGWTAEYSIHVELGSMGRPGRLFMNSAAQQWNDIVNRNAEIARSTIR